MGAGRLTNKFLDARRHRVVRPIVTLFTVLVCLGSSVQVLSITFSGGLREITSTLPQLPVVIPAGQ